MINTKLSLATLLLISSSQAVKVDFLDQKTSGTDSVETTQSGSNCQRCKYQNAYKEEDDCYPKKKYCYHDYDSKYDSKYGGGHNGYNDEYYKPCYNKNYSEHKSKYYPRKPHGPKCYSDKGCPCECEFDQLHSKLNRIYN